ncbi:MAG TPA: T9SS type A sorting domain-containing protein [Bacteroidales bacterium]|jgi:hypothetical protein|nr:T9SS type A sorting domain-containing protein [Bacteroidales bacterium]HOL97993.1 T9SS type A sorting domain-containing protein [Bacteroidales bacterium]HOM36578.1 T9SS type A sorting domain-containing protein [Bacteroidales bacterium]HPD23681.1 T9SS type A sorting domain-containing protein [Bacteroidales bacterium]HRS99796.1 T9SS type A sorting domain-containing protein [Bacteroidales bacterium]
MKKLYYLFLLILISNFSHSQEKKFFIGIGVYDFDNASYAIPGTEITEGLDYNYLKTLSDQKFNLILPYHNLLKCPTKWVTTLPSKEFLDRAELLNLDVILNCPEVNINWYLAPGSSYNSTLCQSGLQYWGDHPAVIGWHVIDEPSQPKFSEISWFYGDIADNNSSHYRLATLYPSYANYEQLFGIPGSLPTMLEYESYVDAYILNTSPNILIGDFYPFVNPTNKYRYFYNLDIFARKSAQYDLPFTMMLAPSLETYPLAISLAEFRYQIFANVFYGAKGIFYWAREASCGGGSYYPGISTNCNLCMNRWDNVYDDVFISDLVDLHNKLINAGDVLTSLEFISAYHVTNQSTVVIGNFDEIPSQSAWSMFQNEPIVQTYFDISNPIVANSGSSLTNIAVSFLKDEYNNVYFWVFNKSLTTQQTIDINFNQSLDLFDVLNITFSLDCNNKTIVLDPGEAELFGIISFQSNFNQCSEVINNFRSDIYSSNILIGGNNCIVTYSEDAEIGYFGESIAIQNNTSILTGSNVSIRAIEPFTCASFKKNSSENIDKIPLSDNISVYPNPNSGDFIIKMIEPLEKNVKIEIINSLGAIVFSKEYEFSDEIVINSDLTSGLYALNIYKDDNVLSTTIVISR